MIQTHNRYAGTTIIVMYFHFNYNLTTSLRKLTLVCKTNPCIYVICI